MTNRRSIFFLLLSIVFGLSALVAYRGSLESAKQSLVPPIIETAPVVIASEELSAGVAIDPSKLEVAEWPVDFLPTGSVELSADIGGRVPKRTIEAGEPVLLPMLHPENTAAGLTALIAENHRAMSVRADSTTLLGGFIQPGSRVDVLAQLRQERVDDQGRPQGMMHFSRTILQNVKVLAVDQSFNELESEKAASAKVVTLEVDPSEAQILAFAAAEGTLSLALRSQHDESLVNLRSTLASDIHGIKPKKQVVKKKKRVARAPRRPTIESVRGSEISEQVL